MTKGMFCVDCNVAIDSEAALPLHFEAHPRRRLRVLQERPDGITEITFKAAGNEQERLRDLDLELP